VAAKERVKRRPTSRFVGEWDELAFQESKGKFPPSVLDETRPTKDKAAKR